MSIEPVESSDASFPIECTIGDEETISTVWNGREINILEEDNKNQVNVVKEKCFSKMQIPLHKNIRHEVALRSFAQPTGRGWNFESFPIPPTKPILAPIPDGETCRKYAEGFHDKILGEIYEKFLQKNLISEEDYKKIASIVGMLFNDVNNHILMAPLYKTDVNWKEVLQPLNRLFQFWHRKWERYGIPPSPNDWPLPEF